MSLSGTASYVPIISGMSQIHSYIYSGISCRVFLHVNSSTSCSITTTDIATQKVEATFPSLIQNRRLLILIAPSTHSHISHFFVFCVSQIIYYAYGQLRYKIVAKRNCNIVALKNYALPLIKSPAYRSAHKKRR